MSSCSIKVLIVKTSALGDIVHTMPVVDYLKEKHGIACIDWVVEKAGATLVQAHPHVRRSIVLDTKQWKKSPFKSKREVVDFTRSLREDEYDILYDFQSNIKSGIITALTRAKVKVGFGRGTVREWPNLLATNTRFDPPGNRSICERNLYLVQKSFGDETPWEIPPRRFLRACSERLVLQSSYKERWMVCFGSRWETKKVLTSLLKEWVGRIVGEGGEVFLAYGNEQEQQEAENIAFGLQGVHLLAPISLPVWQNVMTLMTGVIAVDSVGLHLAGYADVPTFGVFGASSSDLFAPRGSLHDHIQGKCPYGVSFDTRCPHLRRCSTGMCTKALSIEEIWPRFEEWRAKIRCCCAPIS